MKVGRLLALGVAVAAVPSAHSAASSRSLNEAYNDSSVSSSSSSLRFNGWYPCGLSTPQAVADVEQDPDVATADATSSAQVLEFECGELELPLCHEGICSSSKQIDVFIKRLRATKLAPDDQPQQALWVLQGGPGASSSASEYDVPRSHRAECRGCF